MSIPSRTAVPNRQQLPLFKPYFSTFAYEKDHSVMLAGIFQRIVTPSVYVWEKIGVFTAHNISWTRTTLQKDPTKKDLLDHFNRNLVPRIQKQFQKMVAIQFPSSNTKGISLKEWTEDKKLIQEIKDLCETLTEEQKAYPMSLSATLELLFVYSKKFLQESADKDETIIKPSDLLAGHTIVDLTNYIAPRLGDKRIFTLALQSTLGFSAWAMGQNSPFYTHLLKQRSIAVQQQGPVHNFLKEIQEVSKLFESIKDTDKASNQGISFDDKRFFLHCLKEFAIAVGLLFSDSKLGRAIEEEMEDKVTRLLDGEKRQREKREILDERVKKSDLLPFSKSFVKRCKKLNILDSTNDSEKRELSESEKIRQRALRVISGLYYSEINRLKKVRMGRFLSLFFLFSIELLQPREQKSHQLILKGHLNFTKHARDWKSKFQTKWKQKIDKYSKAENRRAAIADAKQTAKEIKDIFLNPANTFYVFSAEEARLELGEVVIKFLMSLFPVEDKNLFDQSRERGRQVVQYFQNLPDITASAIEKWRSVSERVTKKSLPPVSLKRSVSEQITNKKKSSKPLKTEPNQNKEEPKNSNEPKEKPKTLHEQALEEIERQKQKQIEEEKTSPEESKTEDVETKSSQEEQSREEQVKKDKELSPAIPTKLIDILNHLKENDFQLVRHGRHSVFRHAETGVTTPVPGNITRPRGQRVATGTARNIARIVEEAIGSTKKKSKE